MRRGARGDGRRARDDPLLGPGCGGASAATDAARATTRFSDRRRDTTYIGTLRAGVEDEALRRAAEEDEGEDVEDEEAEEAEGDGRRAAGDGPVHGAEVPGPVARAPGRERGVDLGLRRDLCRG